jgi:hypothetical protein
MGDPALVSPGRAGLSGLRGVILTLRFLCELAMLAALAYWGFTVGDGAGRCWPPWSGRASGHG